MSNKKPYSVLFRTIISILVILGIFIGGSLILQLRERSGFITPEGERVDELQ